MYNALLLSKTIFLKQASETQNKWYKLENLEQVGDIH